ncbi:ABC transporter ATP-binding protein [Microlunatus parietis]|uniref:ABC-2 type transport system ATP-binding protein n=1 Tax=Microlunatus parietis TaxID=682979 RepID=A0A7Y9I565_9ACTN|nr:ATP-binding cassette domain-containing protein [Microlunatus parietis]NYE70313.1 ABC-2 type transport system ATP-binding protein [Microlunatus parietis]
MTDAIVAHKLAKRYGGTIAVDDVSFSVAEGETVCLLGPNGAGKSTTVRILATLTRPDGGNAWVAGSSVSTDARAIRARIGYVAQHAGTDVHLTGRENLRIQAAAHGLRRTAAARRTTELLELVGLAAAADRLVGTYSGGMARRLEIAMGIVHEPEVIFLDEPTTGLDPEARTSLWTELSEIVRTRRISMLLTTHYLDEADQLADRVVIINRGTVIIDGTPTALKAQLPGGGSVIIELTRVPPKDVVSRVVRRAGCHDLDLQGSNLRVRTDHGHHSLPVLLNGLREAGFDAASAAVAQPTLDDVYLHHTGQSLATTGPST